MLLPMRLDRLLLPALLTLVVIASGLGLLPASANAAEIFSIRSPTLLQVGDQNRSYGVQLGCIAVNETNSQAALVWLQRHGARGTKINLRPIRQQDGQMVARVSVLKNGLDLGEGMVSEGLATPVACVDSEQAS